MFYGSDNFSVGVGLSIANPSHHNARYMSDQTFHTPNFGDEEFDLPPILPHQQTSDHSHQHMQGNMTYSMGMHGVPDQQGQQHYTSMYLPEHMTTPMTIHSPVTYGGSPPTYTTLSSPHAPSQSPVGGNPHMMHHPQTGARPQPMQPMIPPGSAPPGRSPTNSASPANAETGSEDSDDSVPVSQMQSGVKRPSPEPVPTQVVSNPTPAPVKKPKPQKKKKKRDPNEPQKPVSAYALFFRDTQAAIKGQNPNASFGEVSKIVASMWDALDAEHKNVYKKKTEAAKKEYLKALAAYRASLVSKGAPTDSADGSGMYPPPSFNASISSSQHYQSHAQQGQSYYSAGQAGKKSQQQSPQSSQPNPANQQSPQQGPGSVSQPPPGMPPPPNQQTQPQHSPVQQPPQQQAMMQPMAGGHHIDSNQYGGMRPSPGGYMGTMGDTSHSHTMMQGGMHHGMGGHGGPMGPSGPVMSHMSSDGHDHSQRQMCVRNGCNNMAITSPEWENEYCSSDCVVTHCRDVFTNWVSTNQPGNPNYGNGVK